MTLLLQILIILFILSLVILFSPTTLMVAITNAPFLPTSKNIIKKALKVAGLKQNEKLYDLGSGTGKVLIIGEKKFGAKTIGIEYSIPLFIFSKINLFLHRTKKAKIYRQNFLKTNLKQADVIFLFLTPRAFRNLKHKLIYETKQGVRIVTFSSPLLFWKPKKL